MPTPRPILEPLERPPDWGSLVREVELEVSSPPVFVADAVGIFDEPELAEVADVEPGPVDVELEYVVLAEKIQPFI